MTVRAQIVTPEGEVLPVDEAVYGDIGDACGDADGGDFFQYVVDQHPHKKVAEVRFLCSPPIELRQDDEEDD